jgi:hypothetical protein
VADTSRLLLRAAEARRESKYVEFKGQLDPTNEGEWLELTKDIAAIANIGGGVIVVGVESDGSASHCDLSAALALDGANICNKLTKYLGEDFDDFEIATVTRGSDMVAAVIVGPAEEAPLTFIRPGTYPDPMRPKQQKSAFGRGVYFRHGAKSEPATREDLRLFIDRRLNRVREDWLGGIRQVLAAPAGAEIVAIERVNSDGGTRTIRITTDENAPMYRLADFDVSHPYRQKELVDEVNKRLPNHITINSHDILSVRRAHNIDVQTQPDYVHRPKFGNYQYSDAFIDWLIHQFANDAEFFSIARARYYEMTH